MQKPRFLQKDSEKWGHPARTLGIGPKVSYFRYLGTRCFPL
jgi:hypothetical protein